MREKKINSKKGTSAPGELASWILVIVVVILLIFVFPGFLSSVSENIFKFTKWFVKDPDPVTYQTEEHEETKEVYERFIKELQENFVSQKECYISYSGLETSGGNSIEFFLHNDYSGRIRTEEGGTTDAKTVSGLKPCIVSPSNYVGWYIKGIEDFKDVSKYIEANQISIKGDKLTFKGNEFDFDQKYLIKFDDEHICFILTHSTGVTWYKPLQIITKWGCDFSHYSMDNDCLENIKTKLQKCEGDKDLYCKEMDVVKCRINKDKCYPLFVQDNPVKCKDCGEDFECDDLDNEDDCLVGSQCAVTCDSDPCGKDCTYKINYDPSETKRCFDASVVGEEGKQRTWKECIENGFFPYFSREGLFLTCQKCQADIGCNDIRKDVFVKVPLSTVEEICEADICGLDCVYLGDECIKDIRLKGE